MEAQIRFPAKQLELHSCYNGANGSHGADPAEKSFGPHGMALGMEFQA